jgi:hypothetical protein
MTPLENVANKQQRQKTNNGPELTLILYKTIALQAGRNLQSQEFVDMTGPDRQTVTVDLSRFDAAPITHLCSLCFEGQGAFPAEC